MFPIVWKKVIQSTKYNNEEAKNVLVVGEPDHEISYSGDCREQAFHPRQCFAEVIQLKTGGFI